MDRSAHARPGRRRDTLAVRGESGAPASGRRRLNDNDKPVDRVHRRLEKFIGPHTTRLALKTFSQKTLGVAPDQVRDREVPELIRALRPLLRSMLGEAQGESLVEQLLAECKS